MITTFKETIKSLTESNYGNHITKKPLKATIWYFISYVLLLSTIPLALSIILITYFVPQLPSIMSSKIPEGYIILKKGILETNYPPYKASSPDRVFNFDPSMIVSDGPSTFSAGIYIYKDGVIHVEPDNAPLIQKFSDFPDFQIEKSQVVSWIATHLGRVWLVLFGLVLAAIALGTVVFLAVRAIALLLWSAVLLLFSRLLNKSLSFVSAFKLSLFAAVPGLLISAISTITANEYLGYLNLALFIFLSFSWVWNIKALK